MQGPPHSCAVLCHPGPKGTQPEAHHLSEKQLTDLSRSPFSCPPSLPSLPLPGHRHTKHFHPRPPVLRREISTCVHPFLQRGPGQLKVPGLQTAGSASRSGNPATTWDIHTKLRFTHEQRWEGCFRCARSLWCQLRTAPDYK